MKVTHFRTAAALRRWLQKNHAQATELWIGFYKKGVEQPGASYKEAVDLALCFGWIDGIRKTVDEQSYVNRFTPRKPRSYWSQINIKRFQDLDALGHVAPAGKAAFERRDDAGSNRYSFENKPGELEPADEKAFRRNRAAWTFFEQQPPFYRRLAIFWVTSAKREETRRRRLATLIDDSAAGRRLSIAGGKNLGIAGGKTPGIAGGKKSK